ncbi:MFS transporter [Glycomyces sp. TRM65418]|uniref:MFS transporter n=1 Tax=Glycomyces sp. TRM65418 TaxID=2867006 RepID=UPI001CE712A1|nr:MFS transporter [Glycomyces sp. TRM65418]MCC3763696.1 MFS transporter [Glycomyces sp. TRM65418]QZD57675.1 MFS transporter [Glycomyces sp. TRM65418]
MTLPDPGPARRRIALGAAGTAVLIGSIDAYVLVSVLVDMIGEFDIPVNHLERATPLVTGYLLGYTAGMPLLGRLSDRFGRKPVIHLCLAAFAVGSLVSATATDLAPLVAGRALQGLAGGALLPVTMALAADLFAARRRPAVLGWVGAAQELGAVIGPLFGAGVAALVGWRGIFWINLPLALLAALAIHFALPNARTRRDAGRVDVLGGLLLAVALGLFTVGLYNPEPEASVLPPWGPPTVVGGVAVLVVFGLQQWRSPVRLLEPDGVRWRPFTAGLVASLAAGAVLMVTLVDVQLLAQTLLDLDSGGAALLLLWFLIGLPAGALVGGFLASRFGERLPTVIGFAAAAAAYLWIGRSIPDIESGLALAGAALGVTIAPLSSAALRTTPEDRHGTAAAVVVVARMMGMLVGVAALTSWSLHRFQAATADLDTPLPFGVPEAEFLERQAAYLEALDAALANQYAEVFTAAAGICLAAAIVSAALPGRVRQRSSSLAGAEAG